MLFYAVLTLYVLVCFLLLLVVLLQQGKGGDIAAAFGGASSQTAFGARAGATVLTRATTILGTLFLVGSFALGAMSRSGAGGSVVSGIDAPAESKPTTPALPSTAPPPVPTPPVTTPPPTGGDKGKGGEPPATPPVEAGKQTPPAGKKGDK